MVDNTLKNNALRREKNEMLFGYRFTKIIHFHLS